MGAGSTERERNSAFVISYGRSPWGKNRDSLVRKLELASFSVRIISDQHPFLFDSPMRWLYRILYSELVGVQVVWGLDRYSVRGVLRSLGQVLSALVTISKAIAHPREYATRQHLHAVLNQKHQDALRSFTTNDSHNLVFVFEDDANLLIQPEELQRLLSELNSAAGPATVVNLAPLDSGRLGWPTSSDRILPSPKFFDSTCAYAVSREAAILILRELEARPLLKYASVDWAFSCVAGRSSVNFLMVDVATNLSVMTSQSSLGTRSFRSPKTTHSIRFDSRRAVGESALNPERAGDE